MLPCKLASLVRLHLPGLFLDLRVEEADISAESFLWSYSPVLPCANGMKIVVHQNLPSQGGLLQDVLLGTVSAPKMYFFPGRALISMARELVSN